MRVAVAGALGRMGRVTCAAISQTDDLELVGGLVRAGGTSGSGVAAGAPLVLYDDLGAFFAGARPEVVVDFTFQPVTVQVAREAVERGISPVIGATGWSGSDEAELAALCLRHDVGAALVPNFAMGAVLMMRFAEIAARYFPTAEIVELHHDAKRDKPSGTALRTAARMREAAGGREVPIHSVRLRGLVSHQEVLFGGAGELLTLRHDSLSLESFMAGVLLAVRRVRSHRGLALGLDPFLDAVA